MQVLTAEGERLMRAEHRHARDGPAGALTVTIGLGPLLFGERFGLGSRRPVALCELPATPCSDVSTMVSSRGQPGRAIAAAAET